MSVVNKPLIYLASPYSSRQADAGDRKREEQWRFEMVQNVTHQLMQRGFLVLSPIAYSHQFAVGYKSVGGCWETWKEFDSALIARCDEVWVLKLPGWDLSKGVRSECELARQFGKAVAYVATGDLVPEYEIH